MVRSARTDQKAISVAGGRHAMGGQQFGADTLLVDIRKLNRVLRLDRKGGILEVDTGIEWPDLIDGYLALQNGNRRTWGIAQKQTGADRLTIAGTIAANAHGRGLRMKPFISDLESFVLVDATGLPAPAAEPRTQSYFDWFTAGTAFLESLPPSACDLYRGRRSSGSWKFGQWTT